jgi:multidrug efflux pump subunit AcrA (membrane-fusion protein)
VRFAIPAVHLGAIQRFRSRGQVGVHVVPTGTNPAGGASTDQGPPASETETTSQGASLGSADRQAGRAAGGDPDTLSEDAESGPGSDGMLTFVDNAVDTTTGTILLKGTFANRNGALWPGGFVNVRMRLATDTALTVPAPAVVAGQQGNYVFVVAADGTAQQRKVVVDRIQGDVAVVTGEIRPGERVVTDGQLRLRPGAKVQIKGAGGPGTSPAAAARQGTS